MVKESSVEREQQQQQRKKWMQYAYIKSLF